MTAAIFAIAAVLIIGVTAASFYFIGRTARRDESALYKEGVAKGYRLGYGQGRFDAAVDATNPQDTEPDQRYTGPALDVPEWLKETR